MTRTTDLDLTPRDLTDLASADALMSFLHKLGYDTNGRAALTPESVGLSGESANAVRRIEVLSEYEFFLRIIFAQPKSLTARFRTELVRALSKSNDDHLLILTSDFETLEFVLLDKPKRDRRGPVGAQRIQVVPKTISVNRRKPTRLDLRTLRRFTWTCQDALDQFDKLRSVFDAAAYTGEYFQNRGLFADHFLRDRLKDDGAWRDNPSGMFGFVRDLLRDGPGKWQAQGKQTARDKLYEPIFSHLGYKAVVNRPCKTELTKPDYLLNAASGETLTAAFVYPWDRWLDGPDFHDADTPEENPGACVVTALDEGVADWIVVTNGRLWRLYSRHAHARSTNYYEVDLAEALTASGDTDPNEAFRYWWLFFRPDAYRPQGEAGNWLDRIFRGSRDYAKRLGDRLKDRIFVTIFPHLAQGFLADRTERLGQRARPTEAERDDIFEATLTLLYRLLFLLYAESRDLLPVREAPYGAASLKKIKEEVADKGGVALGDVAERLEKSYSSQETTLYDRLGRLFEAMDKGDPVLNVPTYNGGLFNTTPDDTDRREQRIARFLKEHKVPDCHLAQAIDRLSRDQDERTLGLVFIDYRSLEVRHLGSIYEGLLEFKLKVALEDLTTQAEKNQEKYIPLSKAKARKGKQADVVVRKGEVYLSNDKAERRASGSYYTPDPIVEYIVSNTIGPVLEEKLDGLRSEFREVRKTYDRYLANEKARPSPGVDPKSPESLRRFVVEKTYHTHKDLVERLFDLKALDPAMGSGHFLVEAVDYITDRLITFLNAFPVNPVGFALERTRTSILGSLGEQGVTVDPAKLTDISLLKRHVLKRCIYGVDLNPMAVELAKVSLWLDAFTLGAPLSFLDHHLRPGNSLIGLTVRDLEDVAEGRLHIRKIREQLRPAIETMLQVSRLTDATAAEAEESADLYRQVRERLAGAELALDLLTADDFGVADAKGLVAEGDDLDFTTADKLVASLHDDAERAIVERAEALAHDSLLHFFHWDLAFPEVFFGTTEADLNRLRQGSRIASGARAFDAVVGNPPYVRMEWIKPLKPFLKRHYRCHAERADLFIYFYERAVRLLRPGGRTAFIASSTWTKTKAGAGLRDFLKAESSLDSFLDFGDLPVFEDATTYPCILVTRRQTPSPDQVVASAVVNNLEENDLTRYLRAHTVPVPQAQLETAGWHFEDRVAAQLRDKIRAAGIPLKEYCGSPLRGIVSGLNEAFVIDTPTRDRLISEDPKSAEILKPFLEGKDVKAWRASWRGLWLIYTHHGIDIGRYPAIRTYLNTFKSRLEQRATSAHHEWYELQQPQFAYVEKMQAAKLMWPLITNSPRFVLDEEKFFVNNKIHFLVGDHAWLRYLQGILSSHLAWFILTSIGAPKANDYFELGSGVVEKMPIPAPRGANAVAEFVVRPISWAPKRPSLCNGR